MHAAASWTRAAGRSCGASLPTRNGSDRRRARSTERRKQGAMSSVLPEAPSAEQLSLTADRTRTFAVRLVADLDVASADIHPLGELVARRQLLVCTTPTV